VNQLHIFLLIDIRKEVSDQKAHGLSDGREIKISEDFSADDIKLRRWYLG
jgi:hypothetical protein